MSFFHDNGSNIGCTAKTLETENGWSSLGHAGHTPQLCVNAGIEISSSVDHAIAAGRRLVTHFRRVQLCTKMS